MGSSGDRLCQTSPIPRSPDGDKKEIAKVIQCQNKTNHTKDRYYHDFQAIFPDIDIS